MAEKIVVGPFNRGLRNDVTPFNIDNDSFPVLINAYQWRGRVKRKRGTAPLGRLQRYIGTTDGAGGLVVTILPIPIETGIVSFTIGADIFVDPGTTADPATQTLLTNSGGTGTLNRITGVLTIVGSLANTDVIYFPRLPVMGLEDLNLESSQYPGTIAFDTRYAYNISTQAPYDITDVSFYKNPATGTYSGYVQKTTWTPFWWNGQDYQQFWSTNYEGAFWVTNGINVPFTGATIGMQFKPVVSLVINGVTDVTLEITNHGLVIGDFVYLNEFDEAIITGINFQTGYVIAVPDANHVEVILPNANVVGATTTGIAQYLTSRSNTAVDCIRWYDGNPTDGNVPPTFLTGKGWVNFMPPLSQDLFSIADLPPKQYYLVGARMLLPFKDRLLAIGPVVQASTGSPIYLQDTVVYCQNGTPYYTASFQGDPRFPDITTPPMGHILVPADQTAFPAAWFEDTTGFGGYISAGIQQPAITASTNEDVIIIGFNTIQTKLVYTGNDIVPFNFFLINSELGSSSTFSAINLDEGVISRGSRGIIISSQTQTKRIDLEIPDEAFQVRLADNGAERITAIRDFINEWVYFTYPVNTIPYKFNSTTLLYNYRDNSWARLFESYTTYGIFRKTTGYTWSNIGRTYPSWEEWSVPWNSGNSTLFDPEVIAGNQQGFVVFRDKGIGEANSIYIQAISGNTITSPNHGLNENDYIVITGALGTVGVLVNDLIFSVYTVTEDTFKINPSIASATYLGGGLIERLYIPLIQSKQFPVAWAMARKTRICAQRYLFSTTDDAQITLNIYLSENADNPYNYGGIVPSSNTQNNALVYSTVLYTAPESANIGLTPANDNLQLPTAAEQAQIWHRMNTSLIGDTVQVGFTLSDTQMRAVAEDGSFISQQAEIELHGMILEVTPSQELV